MELGCKLDKTDDPRRYRWLQYFRTIADQYGLRDFILEMSSDGVENDYAVASIYCTPGRKHAWIRLSQGFLDDSPETQRMTVVHELTHCHDALCYNHARTYLKTEMLDTHRMLMEHTVDSIACAIHQFFPLPSEETRFGLQ